jgi:hypothetical protein
MKEVKVDLDKLIWALESWANRDFNEFYLDKESGDVFSADVLASKDPVRFKEVERTPDRFVSVKPLAGHDISALIDDFLDTLGDLEIKDSLAETMLNRGTFVDFKAVLSESPEIKIKWKEFHKREMEQTAKSWFSAGQFKSYRC